MSESPNQEIKEQRSHDRRFAKRYEGKDLTVELLTKTWFGGFKDPVRIELRDFSLGGLSFSSSQKIKNPQILFHIYSRYHTLKSIPAEIVRQQDEGELYVYAVRFRLGFLPQSASRNTYTVLKHMESSARGETYSPEEESLES